jgi:hypothetical protein
MSTAAQHVRRPGSVPPLSPEAVADLPQADYDAMDCTLTNVAALLLLRCRGDARRALGSQWHFGFDEGTLALDRIPLDRQLALLAGVELRALRLATPSLPALADAIASCGPVVVHCDAYELPWLPFHRRVHMQHTFVATAVDAARDAVTVLDTYTNKTEHGEARPIATVAAGRTIADAIERLAGEDHARALSIHPVGEGTASARETIAANARALVHELRDADAIRRFVAYYEAARTPGATPERFALDCWLVARRRELHRRWLADAVAEGSGVTSAFVDELGERVVAPWQRAAMFAHLGERRARQGRDLPSGPFRLIDGELHAAELELATRLLEQVEAAS